jgi:hypothetical protein
LEKNHPPSESELELDALKQELADLESDNHKLRHQAFSAGPRKVEAINLKEQISVAPHDKFSVPIFAAGIALCPRKDAVSLRFGAAFTRLKRKARGRLSRKSWRHCGQKAHSARGRSNPSSGSCRGARSAR